MNIPVRIRSAFAPSDPLDQHIVRCVEAAVRTHRNRVRRVEMRLSDENGPRRGPGDKIAIMEIALSPFGEIVTRGKAADAYESVRRAASRAKRALTRQAGRLVEHRPARHPVEAAG